MLISPLLDTMAMAAVESNSDSAAPEEVGSGDSKFIDFRGPRSDVKYPLNVIYCGGKFIK